jgi:hypothetical protein
MALADTVQVGPLASFKLIAEETAPLPQLLRHNPCSASAPRAPPYIYEKRKDRPHAELYLREAIRQAEQMVQEGSMDVKALDIIRRDLDRILKL